MTHSTPTDAPQGLVSGELASGSPSASGVSEQSVSGTVEEENAVRTISTSSGTLVGRSKDYSPQHLYEVKQRHAHRKVDGYSEWPESCNVNYVGGKKHANSGHTGKYSHPLSNLKLLRGLRPGQADT